MKSADKVKRLINQLKVETSPQTDMKILGDAMDRMERLRRERIGGAGLNVWRTIMKSKVAGLAAAAAVVVVAVIGITSLNGPAAWAQVVGAFNEADNIHIVKMLHCHDGAIIRESESWIKNQTLFRAESDDWCVIDNSSDVLTLYKEHKIGDIRESLTPYWDYTPVILKVLRKASRDEQSEHNILVSKVPEESTDAEHVFAIECRGKWEGKAWVDAVSNLPLRIVGRKVGLADQATQFEIRFDYEPIPDEVFSIAIPPEYSELPRIGVREDREQEYVLLGQVVDVQGNPVVAAQVYASYAHHGRTDDNGRFALPVHPRDGSQSLGPSDFPMFVRAFRSNNLESVAWTIIRNPEAERSQAEGAMIESTHHGVELVITDEYQLAQSIPGDPGEFLFADRDIKVRGILLVMGPASVLRGQVTDTSGEPVAGATVWIQEMQIQSGGNTISVSNLGSEWRFKAFAITDSNGYYQLGNLPTDWYRVEVSARANGRGAGSRAFEPGASNTLDKCDVIVVEGQEVDEGDDDDELAATAK